MNEQPRLRHIVQVQINSNSSNDAIGVPIPNWRTLITRQAFIKPLTTGKEVVQAKQLHSETSHVIFMRFMRGIDSTMRLVYRGRIFEILNVIDVEERNRDLMLLCVERDRGV